jgi:glycosyltransferase involved in cell wall biosynthesis
LRWYAEGTGPRVIFVGKLIVSKGVDLLLAAWPLVHREHPDARLLIVGFGTLDAALRAVVDGFAAGDLGPLRELAERGRGLEGGEEERLSMLSSFIAGLPDGYEDAARTAAPGIRFAGRLEHDEVAIPVAASDALVFPSTFPEAFGMVAAEAAAAGVLPVSAAHSGALEVSRELAGALPDGAGELVSFELDDRSVEAIATRIDAWLTLGEDDRRAVREALRATVERLWSWQGVARGVLAASAAELDRLPRPAGD